MVTSVRGVSVKSIVNLADQNTKIYEAHYGMTQEPASQLIALGYSRDMPLSYDRVTGAVDYTLGQLAAQAAGTSRETFHFVLNNTVVKDNRIPTYGMTYEAARQRNALPVPAGQYGVSGTSGTYNYWDEITLNPPTGAAYAEIKLLYQPTSWEYIQFLYLANDKSVVFLANEGAKLLDAWLATGMAEPYVMASTTWGTAPVPACATPGCARDAHGHARQEGDHVVVVRGQSGRERRLPHLLRPVRQAAVSRERRSGDPHLQGQRPDEPPDLHLRRDRLGRLQRQRRLRRRHGPREPSEQHGQRHGAVTARLPTAGRHRGGPPLFLPT